VPGPIRGDNGPEFTAKAVREWLGRVGVATLDIEPGSPWEDGYIESFNGELRDELLDCEVFDALLEARVLVERYRVLYKPCDPIAARDIGRRRPRRSCRGLRPWELRSCSRPLCPRRSGHRHNEWHHRRGQVNVGRRQREVGAPVS
jgi:putative transposase